MEDERIIELTDDEGGKERFIFLTSLEHDGRQFAVMTPAEPGENEDEEAIVILEMLDSENGEEMELVSVDDDDLAETVFNEYMEMLDEDEDGEDGGEGEEE
jgi:uncharacterized protein YrzB (UPF0473 family)